MIEYGIEEGLRPYSYNITLAFKNLCIKMEYKRKVIFVYYYKDIQFVEYDGAILLLLYKKRSVVKYNSYDIIFKLNKDGYYIEKDEEKEEYHSILLDLVGYYIISLKEQV